MNIPSTTIEWHGSDLATRDAWTRRVEDLRGGGFRELAPRQIEWRRIGNRRLVHDTATGQLWRVAIGIPAMGFDAATAAFLVGDDGSAMMLVPGAPATITELEAQLAERDAQAEQQRQELAATRERRRAAAPVVTMASLERDLPPGCDSLRRCAEWLEHRGGGIELRDGRVVVLAPDDVLQGAYGRVSGRAVVRTLYACEGVIVSASRGKSGAISPDKLPDAAVLPTGALLP